MTIASEITRINTNIASAYTACSDKGATMPDTQNSANLADTIESIPSGSGSKYSSLKNEAVKIKEQVHNGDWTYPYTSTGGHPETLVPNWHFHSSPSYSSVFNYNRKCIRSMFFIDQAPSKIYTGVDSNGAFSVPTDATVSLLSTSGSYEIYEITFASDKYISWSSDMASTDMNVAFSNNLGATYYARARDYYIKYYSVVATDDTYYNSPYIAAAYTSQLGGGYSDPVPYLEDVDFVDYKYVLTSSNYGAITFLKGSLSCIEFYSKLSQGDLTEDSLRNGAITLSASTSSSYLTQYWQYYKHINEFPMALDLSSYSYANLYLNSYSNNTTSSSYINDCCGNFMLKNINSSTTAIYWQHNLSYNAFKFFVNNSETVTGKTLYINEIDRDMINAQDSTLITTLEGKGWTVSVS